MVDFTETTYYSIAQEFRLSNFLQLTAVFFSGEFWLVYFASSTSDATYSQTSLSNGRVLCVHKAMHLTFCSKQGSSCQQSFLISIHLWR